MNAVSVSHPPLMSSAAIPKVSSAAILPKVPTQSFLCPKSKRKPCISLKVGFK